MKASLAFKFFDQWTTGKLMNPKVNGFDYLHRAYNPAIRELVAAFLLLKGKTMAQLTRAEIRELAKWIMESSDMAIRGFLNRLGQNTAGEQAIDVLINKINSIKFMPIIMINIDASGTAYKDFTPRSLGPDA